MQAGSKKGAKKATKLSLIKKTQKSETLPSKSTDCIKDILQGKVDLNETCDFQHPLKSSGRGDCKVKSEKDGKTQATAGTSIGIGACSSRGNPDDTLCCQVCKKNIGHMTLQCREQHVNRCIDKIEAREKQQKEEKHLLETAKTAVLDCPMCGKHFKSENARLVHLKKCSVNVGVSTEKMLQLVKDQEKVRQEQVEAGIVPRELRSKISKTVASKKRKFKNPKNQFEEDVQVAMAISSSLASEQNIMDGQTSGDSVKDGRRKKAKKTVLEDVCLLTTVSDEDRKRRIEEKVGDILHTAYSVSHTNHSALHDSTLKSASQHNSHSLWKMCSQDPVALEMEVFYVGALVPPLSVSQAESGKRLRRLSSIPGREKSFVKKTDNIQEKISVSTPNMSAEDIITASTQTAVVLAELAVDDTDIHDSLVGLQLTQSPDNEADLQASGFCVEKMVLNKSDQDVLVSETLADFKKMINNKDYSDVTVVSCGQKFFAHKVVLAARCPKLLQLMKDSTIALDVSPDIVLMFLNYIYTGDVTLTSSAQSELLKLASDLELHSLADACSKAVLHTETSETLAADENLETSDTEFIESKLDMKEIWGESDSDLDSDKGDQSGDKESQSDSEINDAEYREICCTQKMKLRNKMTGKSDNIVVSNERNMIIENICESSDSTLSSNEMCNVLKIDQSNETESDTEQSVNASSPGKEKDAVSDVYLTDGGESDLYDVVDVDADEEPKQKRIRLSSENQFDKTIKGNDCSQKVLNNTVNKVSGDVNVNITSSKQSYEHENESASNEEDTVDTSNTGFNSSTADLFGSPTPKKSTVALTEDKKFNSSQSNSKVSSPVENKTNSRRTLNTNMIPVIDIDSDSSFEDIADKERGDKSQEDRAPDLHGESYTKTSLFNGDVSGNSQDNGKISEKELDRDEENVSNAQQNKSSSCVDSSDDDLQITGDNFDDLTQHSPTFNQAKCESRMQRLHAVSQKINTTKYLGLKSMTERISDKNQLQPSDSNCIGNGSMCTDASLNSNKEIKSMHTKENNFCDINSPKPFKMKHFKDQVSDSDEIVTIETEDSDACADQEMVTEINRASPGGDLLSDVKLGDTDEPNIEKSPVTDINRKSAFYGKHEISVYSGAGDAMACSPNQSFEENKSDVWDDFDDCGMSYEPPCESPGEASPPTINDPLEQNLRETSPVIGYQQQVENPGQVSPIIPERDEVIDLSKNEDDNNMHNEHEDNELDSDPLEDGDDSFVFKVDDEPDVADKPASLKSGNKGSAFKTPSISEGRGKKRGAWVPPSPFTPMPQYGEMPTPALKKAVQKFGVKPVSKKRMVKVLEDIYHQTHQYETDSECEGDGVEAELGSRQVEDTATTRDQLTSSQGDMSSQDSDITDVLEESCLHMSSDSDTPASPQKNIDLTKKLFDFVKSRPDIHRRILTYEPLELDVLKSEVKEAGIKCSMDKLMDFLDERCIAFTSKNSRKRQTGTRGRQKKTKTKQTEA